MERSQTVRAQTMDAEDTDTAAVKKGSGTNAEWKTTRREFVAGLAVGSLGSGAILSTDAAPTLSEISQQEVLILFRAAKKPFLTDTETAAVLQIDPAEARELLDGLYEAGVIDSTTADGVRIYWLSEPPNMDEEPLPPDKLREEYNRLKEEYLGKNTEGE